MTIVSLKNLDVEIRLKEKKNYNHNKIIITIANFTQKNSSIAKIGSVNLIVKVMERLRRLELEIRIFRHTINFWTFTDIVLIFFSRAR